MVVGTRTLQSENNSYHLRDASFSSYLNSTKAEDGEIDVFEAEKYFNGAIDEQRSKLFEEIKPEYTQLNLQRVRFGTPNIGSESESSWNSGGHLLQRSSKNNNGYYIHDIHPLPPTNRANKNSQIKNFISTLGCNCYCNGKNSVDILDKSSNFKTAARRSIQSRTPMSSYFEDKIERKSLEVFGSPVQRIPVRDDDTGSDASSDLFEIESITTTNTNTNWNSNINVNHRGSIDADGTNTPSEASIDWSVVTASAADISILSDFDDMRTMSFCSNVRKLERNDDPVPERRRRSGILSSCKSYKAVRVAGDGYKGTRNKNKNVGSNACRILSESNLATTRLGVQRKVEAFEDLGNERLGLDHRFITQSPSVHFPRCLYS